VGYQRELPADGTPDALATLLVRQHDLATSPKPTTPAVPVGPTITGPTITGLTITGPAGDRPESSPSSGAHTQPGAAPLTTSAPPAWTQLIHRWRPVDGGSQTLMALTDSGPVADCVIDTWGGQTRQRTFLRSTSKFARPYMLLLIDFKRETEPSTAPELCSTVRPLTTAA
jgi:hypothetical protein